MTIALLWSARDDMESIYGNPAQPWSEWASEIVLRQRIMSGHHMAEETPDAVAQHPGTFFDNIRDKS
jgi:haloacetate dehalogenase